MKRAPIKKPKPSTGSRGTRRKKAPAKPVETCRALRLPSDWVERINERRVNVGERPGGLRFLEYIRSIILSEIDDDPHRPLSPAPQPGRPATKGKGA